MKNLILIILLISPFLSFSQIVNPFSIRYQTNIKGGLVFLSNTSVSCSCSANNEMPPGGNGDNNYYDMDFVDIDSDQSTYMSSSDQLSLPSCSEIIWAGLYWDGLLKDVPQQTSNFTNRDKVKISINNSNYLNITADYILDNDIGKSSYFCFKDLTSIVQANPINSTYRIADLVTKTGSNTFGGWTLVVVYQNVYETMKNITVFDGLANVSENSGTVNIDLSGFLTPPSGAVNFELGVVAHDGDRSQNGDMLEFNGSGTFVPISDALHLADNAFNSTIARNGVLTPLRTPSYNNNLGHDANIYSPDNSSFDFIGNSATNASIRVSTQSETILTSVITSVIDVYEPDLRASVTYNDLNGGSVVPGDILEYSISVKNIGSDVSNGTYLTDTLDDRLLYIPGSLELVYGPNMGVKTDAVNDDQAEYISSGHLIKARIGTGANAISGGNVINSSSGADSTVLRFKVQLVNDCPSWQCGTTLENKAFVFGTGQISGITNGNNGLSDLLDENGCPSPESGIVSVNVNSCPSLEISYTDSVCVGQNIQFSFPSSSFLTYEWSGPNAFSSNISNPEINNAQLNHAGDYFLHVFYNGQSCTDDTLAPVFVSSNPDVNLITSQDDSCYHYGSGFISVVGVGNSPFTYSWSNNDNDSIAENLMAGSYDVTVTDIYGCTILENFIISEPPIFEVQANITSDYNGMDISCFGENDGSAIAVVTGGIAPIVFNWINTNVQTPDIDSLIAGQYIVELTDNMGCKARDTLVLTQPEALNISGNVTNVLCYGNSTGAIDINITGGTLPYVSSWSNNSNNEDLTNIIAGTYTDTVSDINGCSTYQTFNVTQPSATLSISAQSGSILCYGDSTSFIDLTVTGGVEPYSFLWSNGQQSEDLNNLPAGSYTVTVNDNNFCPQDYIINITQPDSITAQFNNLNPICQQGSQGSINMQLAGGTAPYNFQWNNGETTEDISLLYSGTYTCIITDQNLCQQIVQTILTDPDALQLTFTESDVLCYNDSSGSIQISMLNGVAPYIYEWSNNTNSEDAINLSAGSYFVNVTDGNQCGAFMSFTIQQPDTLIYLTSTNIVDLECFGDQDAAINIEVSGGTGTFDYLWSNNQTTQDINSLSAGQYSVTVTDENNCSFNQSFNVTQPEDIIISETHADVACYGQATGEILISTSGGTSPYNYTWSNGSNSEDLNNLPVGNYNLTVTDNNSCVKNISVTIIEPDSALLLNATTSDIMCNGDSVAWIDLTVLGGSPNYSYLWSNNETTQDINSLFAGQYTVTVTDNNLCSNTLIINVSQYETPLNLEGTSVPTCEGKLDGSVSINVSGSNPPYQYQWNNGMTDTILYNLNIGTYTVIVTDQNNCKDSLSINVGQPENQDACVSIEMPNIFTPDGDGKNDYFLPIKTFNIKEYHVSIFNRWGNLVYEADDYKPGWDGKSKGKELHDGIYFYLVKYVDNFDGEGNLQGNVSLIREK